MKYIVLLCSLFFLTLWSPSATAKEPTPVSSIRKFNEEGINKYRLDRRFVYENEEEEQAPEQQTKADEKLGYKLMKWLSRTFSGKTATGLEYAMYAIGVGLIIYLLYLILKMGVANPLRRRNMSIEDDLNISDHEENIHEIDFDTQISEAIRTGQYRRATRLYYLKNLKILSDKNLIKWEINKTNHDYINELKSYVIREGLEHTTFLFDYVWYGNNTINENSFRVISEQMTSFNKKIQQLK